VEAQPGASLWPAVRAGIIACVLVVQFLSAIPGRRLTEQHLATPEGERIVAWLQSALRVVHVQPAPEAVKRRLILIADHGLDLRDALLRPFQGLLDQVGSHQGWGLFQLSSRECFRIWIESRHADADFSIVYRPHGEDQFGLAPWLRYRRLRGIYNPRIISGVSEQYDALVDWIARRIFASDPACVQVRVRMERIDRGTRDQAERTLGFDYERVRAREELMAASSRSEQP
jgi:hypothetical protein